MLLAFLIIINHKDEMKSIDKLQLHDTGFPISW